MMQQAIDRSTQTGGSFLASMLAHGLLLFLLTILAGRAAYEQLANDELTHIAYIEARYGEDVAEKVKLRERPSAKPSPAPPGPGIATDSALNRNRATVAEAAPARPQPEPTPRSLPASAPTIVPPAAVAAPAATQRPQLAAVETPAIAPAAAAAPRQPVQAATLDPRAAPAPARQIIDTGQLERSLAGELTENREAAPRPAAPPPAAAFRPRQAGLEDRGGRAPVGAEPTVAAGAPTQQRGGRVVEGPANLGGGALTGRSADAAGQGPPQGRLAPVGTARGGVAAAGGLVEAAVPAGSGGAGARSGRKTILDYGSGGGGGGGLSSGRGRVSEPPARAIAAAATAGACGGEGESRLAEAVLDGGGQGVGMTISGQIAGRRILRSVPPDYSDRARREGWEGVVAVHFTVLPDGRVKDNVYLEQTSVHRDLNQAALAAIRQFLFAPLAAEQGTLEQWGVITIVFRLH